LVRAVLLRPSANPANDSAGRSTAPGIAGNAADDRAARGAPRDTRRGRRPLRGIARILAIDEQEKSGRIKP